MKAIGKPAVQVAILLMLCMSVMPEAQCQTYRVLYQFASSGGYNAGDVALDRGGNLYGIAMQGGNYNGPCAPLSGCGLAYKLTFKNGAWIFTPLYEFAGGTDGAYPVRLFIGPDGTPYGSTGEGGGTGCSAGFGCGTVFTLRPQPKPCFSTFCPWIETVLHRFNGSDGYYPWGLTIDATGTIYGGTFLGGTGTGCNGNGCGVLFQLTRSGGSWVENVLYSFTGGNDGSSPGTPVIDSAGHIHGATEYGGQFQCGTGYQVTDTDQGYLLQTLYAFNPQIGDPCEPRGGIIIDSAGNLYGGSLGNSLGPGGVFELSPTQPGNWSETVLYLGPLDGQDSAGPLIADSAGNLYGTTYGTGVNNGGSIFKLTRSGSGWTYTVLHQFTDDNLGAQPDGRLAVDSHGNIFGTTTRGGQNESGVVFELTPN